MYIIAFDDNFVIVLDYRYLHSLSIEKLEELEKLEKTSLMIFN